MLVYLTLGNDTSTQPACQVCPSTVCIGNAPYLGFSNNHDVARRHGQCANNIPFRAQAEGTTSPFGARNLACSCLCHPTSTDRLPQLAETSSLAYPTDRHVCYLLMRRSCAGEEELHCARQFVQSYVAPSFELPDAIKPDTLLFATQKLHTIASPPADATAIVGRPALRTICRSGRPNQASLRAQISAYATDGTAAQPRKEIEI